MDQRRVSAEFTVAATFAASIIIAALNWINASVLPIGQGVAGSILIRILAATGTYLLLFRFIIWIYRKVLWSRINARNYLGGHWVYVYNVYNFEDDQWDTENEDEGTVRIAHSIEDITIHGESHTRLHDTDAKALVSAWKSVAASLWGERLNAAIIMTSAEGTANSFAQLQVITQPNKYGFIPVRPTEMQGFYYITASGKSPARYGRVELRRCDGSKEA